MIDPPFRASFFDGLLDALDASDARDVGLCVPFELATEGLPAALAGRVVLLEPGGPGAAGAWYFAGPPAFVPPWLIGRALARGRATISCFGPAGFARISILRIAQEIAKDHAIRFLRARDARSAAVRLARLRRPARAERPAGPGNAPGRDIEALFHALDERHGATAARIDLAMVNVGLGPGGAERQIVDTAIALAEKGRRIAVAMERPNAPDARFHEAAVRSAGVTVVDARDGLGDAAAFLARLPASLGAPLVALRPRFLADTLGLARTLDALRPDVVHAWQDASAARGGLAALLIGVRRIVLSGVSLAPHWVPELEPEIAPIYRLLARHGSVELINNSRAGATSYEDWLGLPAGTIKVVPNGVGARFFARETGGAAKTWRARHAIPQDAKLVVGVMRLAPEKRPLLWIEAAARLAARRDDVRFAVLGAGPMARDCEASAAALGLGRRALFVGASPDVADALEEADALLLTSAVEGLPNVVLEAQAMGVPVVATDVGDVRAAIAPGGGETLDANATPETLAAAIERALAPEARARARAGGPAHVAEKFGLRAMLAASESVYGWA